MKKSIFTLLALASVTFVQAQDFEVDSIQYQINTIKTNEVNVWGYTCKSGIVNVPSTVVNPSDKETYTVTGVAGVVLPPDDEWWKDPTPNGFYAKTDLKTVTLPSTVKTIGYGAFQQSSLTGIEMPDEMDSIGSEVFVWCTNLASVKMPKTLRVLGNELFTNCTALKSISVPSGITWSEYAPYGVFDRCSYLTDVTLPEDMTTVPKTFFQYCSFLPSIQLPKGITSIGFQAFDGCLTLKSIELPSGVTKIGNMAFQDCASFTEFTCNENLKTINYLAFNQCYYLTKINISASVDSIDSRAFDRCMLLTDINVASANNKYTSDYGLLLSKDKKTLVVRPYSENNVYTIPEGIETLGASSIYNQPGKVFILPSSLKAIATNAFYGDSILSLHFKTATPPTIESGQFNYALKGAVACVPKGAAAAYKAVSALSNFRIQEEESVPFVYTGITPEDNKYLKSIDTLKVAFDEVATLSEAAPKVLVRENGSVINTDTYGSWKAQLDASGKLLTLAFVDNSGAAAKLPFTAGKTYSILIPAGIVANAAGLKNDSIIISENGPDLLVVTSVTPADGSNLNELSKVDIYFDNDVNWVSSRQSHNFTMYVNGVETALPQGFMIDSQIDFSNSKHVSFEIDDKTWTASPITFNAGSTYKIVIPAGILSKKSHSATLNDDIVLTYSGATPTTAIKDISVDGGKDTIYTITGMKVKGNLESLSHGIYIVNGKTVLVK